MKSVKNIFKLSRAQWISVAVLASSLGLAVAVTLPNIFVAGTTISAGQVNANFAALNGALPLVWASTDTTGGGISITAGGKTEVNSVSINAPAAGFVVISGSVFINNGGVSTPLVLNPLIDGAELFPTAGFQASFTAAADLAGAAELFSLAYTITIPIAAGAHTVSQVAGPFFGTTDFFYNRNNLTVLFLPGSQVTYTPLAAPAQPGVAEQAGSNPFGL